MHVVLGYKYELRVNNKEQALLHQCASTSRFAWNWGLADRLKLYNDNSGEARFTDALKQHKAINKLKQTDFSWMYKYSKCIPQEALRDLDRAFKTYNANRKKGKGKRKLKERKTNQHSGFPKFKKKHRSKDSFRLTGVIRLFPKQKLVQLPRLGRLRLRERPLLPEMSRILNVTVSRTADKWYVSFTVEEFRPELQLCSQPQQKSISGEVLGVDAGLQVFAMFSNGLAIPSPKFLLKRLKKFRRLSQNHSRKRLGSKNRKKSTRKLARFHKRVTDSRKDFLHKTSLSLTKNHSVLIVEDLNVKGLMMNKKQAKYWQDLAHGELQRLLEYKAEWYGALLVRVPRFFPSSKLCSNCLWYHKNLTLNDRIYICQLCGLELDRDLNAARNLENYYYWHHLLFPRKSDVCKTVTVSSPETLNACGELVRPSTSGHSSMNQE